MSRWVDTFDSGSFAQNWKSLKSLLGQKADFKPAESSVLIEYARFKKAYTFIDEIIENLDKDLIQPEEFDGSNLPSYLSQSRTHLNNFFKNSSLSSITEANKQIDFVLAYLNKYHHYSNTASRAITRYFNENKKLVEDYLISFDSDASSKLDELTSILTEAIQSESGLKRIIEKIDNLETKFFDSEGTESRIDNLEQKIDSIHESATKTLSKIDSLDDEANNLVTRINSFHEDAQSNLDEVKDSRAEFDDKLREIRVFYALVFGEKDAEGKVTSPGLKLELNTLKKELEDEILTRKQKLEKEKNDFLLYVQTTKKEIKELLGHATTASLSASYRRERKSYSKQIALYTNLFYFSLGALFIAGIAASVMGYLGGWSSEKALTILMINSPMIAAAIWLTTFSSKRRAEAYKLQQEYGHKVAITSSYQGFKRQIEQLGEDSPLLHDLLESTIKAIDKNPSGTYENVKADEHPLVDALREAIDGTKNAVSNIKKKQS